MLKQKYTILIYTDGSCDKNPGHIGSWCFIVYKDCILRHIKLSAHMYTNKITSIFMELKAFYMAIIYAYKMYCQAKNTKYQLTIYTDCMYIVNIYNKVHNPKAHIHIWKKIFALNTKSIYVLWVKGHAKCKKNALVDKLARDAMLQLKNT